MPTPCITMQAKKCHYCGYGFLNLIEKPVHSQLLARLGTQNFTIPRNYIFFHFQVGSIFALTYVPSGNAKLSSDGKITCQHGPMECLINKVDACFLHYYPDRYSVRSGFKQNNMKSPITCQALFLIMVASVCTLNKCS